MDLIFALMVGIRFRGGNFVPGGVIGLEEVCAVRQKPVNFANPGMSAAGAAVIVEIGKSRFRWDVSIT